MLPESYFTDVTAGLAFFAYGGWLLYLRHCLQNQITASKKILLISNLAILFCHGCYVISLIFTQEGIDLGLSPSLALSSWLMTALILVPALRHDFERITFIAYPIAMASLLISLVFDGLIFHSHLPKLQDLSSALLTHLLLSISAYSLLGITVMHTVLVSWQHHHLKNTHNNNQNKSTSAPIQSLLIQYLPPLETMEKVLFNLLAIGLVLLTGAIVSGWLFMEDMFAQKLSHKIVFSISAWIVFVILLLGRYYLGWRGNRAISWTYSGFALLLLGYLGSKLVIEFII